MKKPICFLVLLTCSALIAAGQSDLSKTGKPQPKGSSSSSGVVVEAGPTGCLKERAGTFSLYAEGTLYVLKGHEKELAGHSGDEVRVTGTMVLPQGSAALHFSGPMTINVRTVKILHVNNPAGRAPELGPVSDWKTISSTKYGVRFRVPKTFVQLQPENLHINVNFVTPENVATLGGFSFPREIYPNTKFSGGSFAVYINPDIHTEGTCRQFSQFEPTRFLLSTIHGVKFRQTLLGFGAAGTLSDVYYFHTYQNGLCYEFGFDFDNIDSTLDDLPYCAIQSINTKNERKLIDTLLSAVRFVKPGYHPPEPAKPRLTRPPVVTSFTQTPVPSNIAQKVLVTWTTQGADYVQIHWPCTKSVYVGGRCKTKPDRNFPPAGHETLLLSNFNKSPATVEFTVEPFRAGVGYPKQSKTLTFTLTPEPLNPAHK